MGNSNQWTWLGVTGNGAYSLAMPYATQNKLVMMMYHQELSNHRTDGIFD